MNTRKWKTKTGKKIRIKDMTNSHILNTIAFLERAANSGRCGCSYYNYEACFCRSSINPATIWNGYGDLIVEATKRNIL